MRVISSVLSMQRGIVRRLALATVAGLLGSVLAVWAAEKADVSDLAPQAISVTARSIPFSSREPDRKTFGKLALLGEVVLTSPSEYFGGYSALAVDEKGERFLAISDSGSWLSGRLDYQNGQVSGLADARIGAIPQADGRPLQGSRDRDAEALVPLEPGRLEGRYLIGFEGRHRIEEYAFEQDELHGPVGKRPLPEQLKGMSSNAGLEDLAILRGGPFSGAMVAFAERKLTAEGNHTGALVKDGKSHPLFLKRHEQFDVTDMQSLEDGSLIVLERSFNRETSRLDIRLRRIDAADIKPGAILDGEALLEAGPGLEIDNFEGLAIHRDPSGETVLTLISDDNFNFFQRTLLAQFKLQ
jgi:hypothetical protein